MIATRGNPPAERIESIRCGIVLRGASPDMIVGDAEKAQKRTQGLAAARHLGVSTGAHSFAVAPA